MAVPGEPISSSGTPGLSGLRVYFGTSDGSIQEIGYNFGDGTPYYNIWFAFDGADADAGVASVINDKVNHVYLRNSTTGVLQLWTWDYKVPTVQQAWEVRLDIPGTARVADNGSIAAATDGTSTDYIFYQDSNGKTVGATYSGSSISNIESDVASISTATVGYSLAAAWSSSADEAIVMSQSGSNTTNLLFSGVTGSGSSNATTFDTQA